MNVQFSVSPSRLAVAAVVAVAAPAPSPMGVKMVFAMCSPSSEKLLSTAAPIASAAPPPMAMPINVFRRRLDRSWSVTRNTSARGTETRSAFTRREIASSEQAENAPSIDLRLVRTTRIF